MSGSSSRQGIQPEGARDATKLGFSQGVRVGDVLYVSGQVSRAEGLAAQVTEAWASVLAVVEAAGGRPSDIVKVNLFTLEEAAWATFQPLVEAAMEPPYPAATMVKVVGLASPRYLIEIEAIAQVSG